MKSHESDQVELATLIYKDACAKCIAVNPDLRDIKTIVSRVKSEGLSFLTITLPAFCVDFERSLADGRIDPSSFRSFRKVGAIPAFLQGMLGRLFDRSTGGLYGQIADSVDDRPVIVGSIRQICRAFTKLGVDCRPERVSSAIEGFVNTERDLNEANLSLSDVNDFVNVSSHLWSHIFRDCDLRDMVPRHGPGATVERVTGNQKYVWQSWHDRLEPYFPVLETAYSLSSYKSPEFESVSIISEELEPPVRVTPVPKTQKGPRIIAIEPCCMQYTQQAIRRYLYDRLGSHKLTKGHVNFRDQQVNRDLAMRASSTGLMATLDLSDASDRVLCDLALCMFDSVPDLRDAIFACRSSRASLPDGRIIGPLKKFASMGSALCFPVESMYFYTICIGAYLEEHNLPVTDRNVLKASRFVYVYGDDIIVPARLAIKVRDHLQKYHCKVNMRKSFWTGKFRESCGMDAYDGEEVTPTYIRQLRPTNLQQADQIISWIRTAALFYKRGYWLTSEHMYKMCERVLGKLPHVSDNSPSLGRISFQQYRSIGRWNRYLHRFEVKSWTAVPVYRTDKLEGYGALQKSLLSLATTRNIEDSKADSDNLERTARHGAVALRRRWLPVT